MSAFNARPGVVLMRVRVVGKSNGVGLSRDLNLLSDGLRGCGCSVEVLAVTAATSHRRRSPLAQGQALLRRWWRRRHDKAAYTFDVNIMMEHIWPDSLAAAPVNVIVPNPEWFDRHDRRLLKWVEQVWAKTGNTKQIFARLGKQGDLIGFDSEDRLDVAVPRNREFFHLAGKSAMKGTQRLLQIWRQHPHWPRLTVVQHLREGEQADGGANIQVISGFLDDGELQRLQNACVFHLCTSETEGWGHYLVEAMSVGAVTITLDAPPMNELVTPERGCLLSCSASRRQKLAQCYEFEAMSLGDTVARAMAMSASEVESIGAAARQWFVDNKAGFGARIKQALERLDV
jgi:glycosyltransferase involved in cell wall biosynthesis